LAGATSSVLRRHLTPTCMPTAVSVNVALRAAAGSADWYLKGSMEYGVSAC
jgi:hypothetical protein